MKKYKTLIAIVLTALIIPLGITFAGSNPDPGESGTKNILISATEKTLKTQLFYEIKDVLMKPVYLSFTNKNLAGTAEIFVKVQENGKICLCKVESDNDYLESLIAKKYNSMNLWTDTKFAGTVYKFTVINK